MVKKPSTMQLYIVRDNAQYVVVIGRNERDCLETFQKEYSKLPSRWDCYAPGEWDVRPHKELRLEKVLVSDTVYGCKPDGFRPVWFYTPSKNALVCVEEGCGDNLLPEDRAEGLLDYLEITTYSLDDTELSEDDGGELMLPYMVQEHYGCLADAIPDALDFLYGDMFLDAMILPTE